MIGMGMADNDGREACNKFPIIPSLFFPFAIVEAAGIEEYIFITDLQQMHGAAYCSVCSIACVFKCICWRCAKQEE